MAMEIPRAEKAPQEGFLHEGERRGRGKGVAARVGTAEIAAMGKGNAQEGRLPSHRNAPSGHSGVPVGLFYAKSTQYSLLQNARPSGSLRSPCGGLRTVTPLRDIPVFRSAYFTQRVHSTLCSKTLDLQVRCAHPAGTGEPKIPPSSVPCGCRNVREGDAAENGGEERRKVVEIMTCL